MTDHHPTFEQYMSLSKSSHRGHDQLVKMWAAGEAGRARSGRGFSTPAQVRGIIELGMLRDSIPDDPAEVRRLIDVTLRDIEMGYFKTPRRTEFTPVEDEPFPVAECEPDPKGPPGLRLRLWWMRCRLQWMLARLDGGPARTLRTRLASSAVGGMVVYPVITFILGVAPNPAVFLALPVASLVTSAILWMIWDSRRVPAIDKVIREAT